MVNAVFRKRSDAGNPIVWPKQICQFPFCMCIVFLFMTVCRLQVIAAGFNSGSSSGRLSASNLRRKNMQKETGNSDSKKSRANSKDGKVQASKKNSDDLTIHDSPSWASERGHETVDGVEYYYFTDRENDGAVLENNRQCAINIMDDRTTLVLPELLGGLPLVALGSGSCMNLVDIEEVKLPPKLRQIGYHAFEGCSSLKSIVLPNDSRKCGGCRTLCLFRMYVT